MKPIPELYKKAAKLQGTIEELYYETWDSLHYDQKDIKLQKKALIYLPFGYDADKQYKILYLMHGGWRTEETLLKGVAGPSLPPWVKEAPPSYFKNVLDNGIQEGDIKPLIVVCPTHNNLHNTDSGDYDLAVKLTANYYHEFRNDLVPAVESRYCQKTLDASEDGFRKSRDYRIFGGYSMGGVCTWHIMEHCMDMVKYYMPMSSGQTNTVDNIMKEIRTRRWQMNDFMIYSATGRKDFAYEGFNHEMENLQNVLESYYGKKCTNIAYHISEDGIHDLDHAHEYTFNLLRELSKVE